MVGENFDFAFFVGNFGGFETDASDDAFKAVYLSDDGVANTELILGNDGNTSDEILNQ